MLSPDEFTVLTVASRIASTCVGPRPSFELRSKRDDLIHVLDEYRIVQASVALARALLVEVRRTAPDVG